MSERATGYHAHGLCVVGIDPGSEPCNEHGRDAARLMVGPHIHAGMLKRYGNPPA